MNPFGSIVIGLGIRTSDVDCYVSFPPQSNANRSQGVVYKARYLLSQHREFTELFAIPRAKVPILKFYHLPTGRHCDLSFKSPSGVRNSQLQATLLHMDQRGIPLAVLIKYWSKVHNFTGTNLLPNYALTLLVVFYLQQVNMLPAVFNLQKYMQAHMVDGWNTAFDESMTFETDNKDSLYELLGGFFDYYSKFDFSHWIISPYLGCTVNKETFQRLDNVPDEFRLYKHNVRSKMCRPLRLDSQMCIQDPFDHSRNCSVAVYPALFNKICAFIKDASKRFADTSSDHFLKLILTKRPQNGPEALKQHKPRHIGVALPIQKKKAPRKKKEITANIRAVFMEINRKKQFK